MHLQRLLLLAFVAVVVADEATVTTPFGTLQGLLNPQAREFRGVPYAAPPVGALRWKSPGAPVPWSGTRNATADGNGCLQRCHEPPKACPAIVAEDCLYLNVFTPRAVSAFAPPWPVLLFIHGGNFRDSHGGGPLYNSSALASSQGVLVVSINYRLGVQGFLHANDTRDASPAAITGNYGLQDQRAALQWVQSSIASFGGDPTRVTLSGQSAGSMSAAAHLISPASAGLFHGVILISEPFALPFRTPLSAYDAAAAVMDAANCSAAAGMRGFPSPAECMRAQSVEALLDAQDAAASNVVADLRELLQIFMPFCPTTGTPDVPNWPLYSWQGRPGAAPVADVPIMVGTVSQGE